LRVVDDFGFFAQKFIRFFGYHRVAVFILRKSVAVCARFIRAVHHSVLLIKFISGKIG